MKLIQEALFWGGMPLLEGTILAQGGGEMKDSTRNKERSRRDPSREREETGEKLVEETKRR
jgi:hypothetical protein